MEAGRPAENESDSLLVSVAYSHRVPTERADGGPAAKIAASRGRGKIAASRGRASVRLLAGRAVAGAVRAPVAVKAERHSLRQMNNADRGLIEGLGIDDVQR